VVSFQGILDAVGGVSECFYSTEVIHAFTYYI
jgi:hypothetical protein